MVSGALLLVAVMLLAPTFSLFLRQGDEGGQKLE